MGNRFEGIKARYAERVAPNRVRCVLCPRLCVIAEGQTGYCKVRSCQAGELVLTVYGRCSGLCLDPIEKKPLYHFFPDSPVLSFGTVGCNLGCDFCQNWQLSKCGANEAFLEEAEPRRIAELAKEAGALSVAFTYNEPVISLEYAVDTAAACHELGIKTVAVTGGYINAPAAREFFGCMDAANIDLKAFSDDFYRRRCQARLEPVLDLLQLVRQETPTWLELTTLLISGENNADDEIDRLTKWIVTELGPTVPLHFSAFHPDYKLRAPARTSLAELERARHIGLANGLKFIYLGNLSSPSGSDTKCPACAALLIGRSQLTVSSYHLDAQGCCSACGYKVPGRFSTQAGAWQGQRRAVSLDPEGD